MQEEELECVLMVCLIVRCVVFFVKRRRSASAGRVQRKVKRMGEAASRREVCVASAV